MFAIETYSSIIINFISHLDTAACAGSILAEAFYLLGRL